MGITAGDATGGVGLALPKFATGGGIFLSSLGIPTSFGAPFMALVMVSFLLTSTDTALRLGRYLFEEIVGTPDNTVEEVASNRYANSLFQCIVAYILIASGTWTPLWQLFGEREPAPRRARAPHRDGVARELGREQTAHQHRRPDGADVRHHRLSR